MDVRRVIEANISSLRGGLKRARIEMVKLEASWVESQLPENVREIKKRVAIDLEKYKRERVNESRDKVEWVKETMNDCDRHYVCKWMKDKLRRDNPSDENNDVRKSESDEIRDEMKQVIDIAIENDKEVKKSDDEILEKKLITVYGDIQLSQDEKKFLSLGPYFPLMEDVKEEVAAQDFLIGLTKVRWTRMGLDSMVIYN